MSTGTLYLFSAEPSFPLLCSKKKSWLLHNTAFWNLAGRPPCLLSTFAKSLLFSLQLVILRAKAQWIMDPFAVLSFDLSWTQMMFDIGWPGEVKIIFKMQLCVALAPRHLTCHVWSLVEPWLGSPSYDRMARYSPCKISHLVNPYTGWNYVFLHKMEDFFPLQFYSFFPSQEQMFSKESRLKNHRPSFLWKQLERDYEHNW